MWVKICGLMNPENAAIVADLAPDAIGLNFYSKSARYITPDTAISICSVLPPHVVPVGLFVNESLQSILDICHFCSLNTVQLHGDEPLEFLTQLQKQLPEVEIIRAFRYGENKLAPLAAIVSAYQQNQIRIKALLIDAHANGKYGGTGQHLPWNELPEQFDYQNWPPLILAGGLRPDNVVQAAQQSHAWGVDTASGVENQPGIKDRKLVKQFIENARMATQKPF